MQFILPWQYNRGIASRLIISYGAFQNDNFELKRNSVMESTGAVDTKKPNNELQDDENQDTNPPMGNISEKINARFVKNSDLNSNYSGSLKIRTPKNPDFCVFAKQDLSKKSGFFCSGQTELVLKIRTYESDILY